MTDMLLDVPRNKTRLEIAKENHTIHTYHSPGMDEGKDWVAVLMKPVWKMGYGVTEGMGIPECFSHVARLIEEGGYCGFGETETDAVVDVCRQNNILVTL